MFSGEKKQWDIGSTFPSYSLDTGQGGREMCREERQVERELRNMRHDNEQTVDIAGGVQSSLLLVKLPVTQHPLESPILSINPVRSSQCSSL